MTATTACLCGACGAEFDAAPVRAHRLMCGDSTSATDVERLADGAEADLCFTSPPYGQQRNYKTGGIADWDALMQGVFANPPLRTEGQLLVNLGMVHRDNEWAPYWDGWIDWMRKAGWRRFGWYVWDQGPGLPGDWNGRLAPAHEFIFHFNREAERARKTKDKLPASIRVKRKNDVGLRGKDGVLRPLANPQAFAQPSKIPDSVIRVGRQHGGIGKAGKHPAIFPVALVAEVVTAFSDAGDVIYEPFSGSGTSIIAAEQQARICLAMELAPEYTDVAVRRFQLFAGVPAILESDGRTFEQVAGARTDGA